jgi:hypothetical protein
MLEIEIRGHTYRIGKLNPRQQFHVQRRLAPAIFEFGKVAAQGEFSINSLDGVARAVATMAEDDVDYVLDHCLSVVKRQEGNGWAALTAGNTRNFMFEDITSDCMMEIVWKVLAENLGNFMDVLGSNSPQTPASKQS